MRTILFTVCGLILAGAGCFSRTDVAPPGPTASGLIFGENAIYVAEQPPGETVIVSSVTLSAPGYVVIKKDDPVSGSIVGASELLAAGESAGIEVVVAVGMTDGETLYAALYKDDGDGFFSRGDLPFLDGPGDPMYMIFEVTAGASVDVPQVSL